MTLQHPEHDGSPSRSPSPVIEARDFDANRKHPGSNSASVTVGDGDDDGSSRHLLSDSESLLSDVVDGIIEEDRRKFARELKRWGSYASAILSWWVMIICSIGTLANYCSLCAGSLTAFSLYGYRFGEDLKYNQYQINAISISSGLAMYLPVPIFGYLVDRYSPRPVSLFAGIVFVFGYFMAAFTYKSGPPTSGGWPFGVMILSFVSIGLGTCSMYLAAVTACAKNFGNSKYKGVALASPIACFGLSGMWQSQVGSKLLYQTKPEAYGDDSIKVDVFRYFIFLGAVLFAMGLLGAVAQVVVDQGELIDDAVEALQRSGMLEDSPFFRHNVLYESGSRSYGTLSASQSVRSSETTEAEPEDLSASMLKSRDEEGLKKAWLLNGETRRFLADHTMWLLALGFFLVVGPVETYINNVGTIIGTFYPPPQSVPTANSRDSHVSILAIASTAARIAAGIISDVLSPSPTPPGQYRAHTPSASQILDPFDAHAQKSRRCTVSRLTLLVGTAGVFTIGTIYMLAVVPSKPESFPFVTALFGLVNGAAFALVPLLISSVWGVENFGTNWGIVATMPAIGATIWSALYSVGYERGSVDGLQCYGMNCWSGVMGGMLGASLIAVVSWTLVGWGRDGWWKRGLVV